MTPVESLREAARLMRARAETARPGPWGPHYHEVTAPAAVVIDNDIAAVAWTDEPKDEPTAAHIASWHPAVALAVADMLDAAREWAAPDEPEFTTALAVARTYLGSAS